MALRTQLLRLAPIVGLMLASSGCIHLGGCGTCGGRGPAGCGYDSGCGCDPGGATCQPCGLRSQRGCGGCGRCGGCNCGLGAALTNAELRLSSCLYHRSNAIPDTLPLGSTVRAWYQAMETNAEAADFIVHQLDFVGETARLTPDGRDHIWEIAARMRSTPFPVIVERSDNNSNPELDALRRQVVVAALTSLGNPDAEQRTVVSTPYGPGYRSLQAEPMYFRHVNSGFGGGGGFGGGLGGFGGGLGGGGGFGGGF